jgi:hypothetical protein
LEETASNETNSPSKTPRRHPTGCA